jgi:multidrug efflux pump subunit AcrB
VSSLIAQVGEGTSDPKQGMSFGNTPHMGRVQVSFVEFKDRRGVSTQNVLEDIREAVRYKYPGVQITVDKDPVGPPQGKAINIEVIGDDYDSLIVLADKMKSFINARNIPGIEELKLDVETGKPELIIEIDRAKARRLNLSSGQIGSAIRTAVFGKEVSKYKEGEDDYPIMVRFDKRFRNNIETLMNQRITFRDQLTGKISQVPVSAVATVRKTTTYSAVKRKNLRRVVTIHSNVEVGHNPTETVNNIKMMLQDFDMPPDYEFKFTGEQEEQAKELAFLSKALMIAVFLIFLIMVSQFNSASTPFIIIASVVFSLIGVLLGLVIFQMDFIIIMTMIGIISLAGVVVNNAIVLLDYTNLLMKRRRIAIAEETESNADEVTLNLEEIRDCIVEGGKTRLRPVLLTAMTTILGLFPLAIGLNINFFTLFSEFDPQFFIGGDNVLFWGPIAWTVIFGLTFATFLTLVIVPIMYYLVNLAQVRLKGRSEANLSA